jgi:hypothetical protein
MSAPTAAAGVVLPGFLRSTELTSTWRGSLDDYCAAWVEIEDPDRPMMTVNAISPSQVLQHDDRGIMMGEAAEAWFRAVAGT